MRSLTGSSRPTPPGPLKLLSFGATIKQYSIALPASGPASTFKTVNDCNEDTEISSVGFM